MLRYRKAWRRAFWPFFAACAVFVISARAQEAKPRKPSGIFSLFVENDVFAGTDRGYTNGVKLVWVSPELNGCPPNFRLPDWLDFLSRKLSPFQAPGSRRVVSVFFGQNIYTPNDIERSDLIVWDRPYAGITYAGLGFHSFGRSSLDTFELKIGIVGPHSFAGDMQKFVHRVFGFRPVNGWAHQLKDEPVLGIAYDHKWKAWQGEKPSGFGSDVIFHGGGELSNALTGANTGVELRLGWNIPRDFGTSCIQAGPDSSSLLEDRESRRSGQGRFGLYGFLVFEGHAVARDLFLDGNSFGQSHHVEKYPFRGDISLGLALRHKRLKLSFGYIYETKQFTTQTRHPIFGSWQVALDALD